MLKGGASSYTWSQSDLEDLEPSPSSQSQSTSSNVSRAPPDGSNNRDGSGHQQSLSISLDFLKHGGDDEENLDTRTGAQRGSSAWNTSSPRPTSLARHLSQKTQAQPHQSGSIPIGGVGGGGGLSGSPSHHQQAGSPFSSAHSDAHSPWANDHSSSWYRRTSNLVEASDPVVLSSSQRSNRERSLSRGAAWSHDGGSTGPNGSSAFGTSPHSAADVDATGFNRKTTDSPASESSFRHWPPDVHHRGHTVSSAALLRSQSASQSSNPAAMAASPNLGFVPWALNAPDPITRQSATVDGAPGRPASRDRRGPSPSRSEAKDYSASPRVLETMPEGIEHHTFSSHGPGNGEQPYHPARHRQRASSSAAAFGTVAGDHDGAWMGTSPRGGGDDVRRPAFADWPSPVRQHRDGHAHGHGHASWEDGAETARQSPVERKASLAHYGESPTSYQHAAKQAQQHQAAHPPPSTHFFGSESRRHSFSTPADSLAGGLTASGRRAVGFEPVCDTVGPTRSASVDRDRLAYLESETPRSRVAAGGPRGRGGGLAFSEDDLATDLGQLNAELDKISAEQQEYDARAARGAGMNVRVPSTQAAATGVHASSMPPLFGQQYSSPPDWATVLSDDGPGRGDAGGWPRADDGYRSSHFPPSKSRSASVGPRGSSPSEVQREVHRHRAESVTVARSSESSAGFGLSPNAKAFAVGAGGHRGAPFNAYASPFPHVGHAQQPQPQQQQQHGVDPNQYMPPGYPSPHHHHHGHPHPHHLSGMPPPPPPPPPQQQPPMLNEWALHSLATLAPSAGGAGPGGFSASAANNNNAGPNSLQDLGRGVPLSNLPLDTRLYIVGFKQGRTDLFFKPASPLGMQQQQQQVGVDGRNGEDDIRRDDLVIVEADRGKDVGRVLNDTLTVEGVRNFIAVQANEAPTQQQQGTSNAANGPNGNGNGNGNGPTTSSTTTSTTSLGSRAAIAARSINPKRLYCLASPADRSLLASKAADEERALSMCIAKVQQRGLAMHVVAAELQWDRRKLTFYYTAASRVDFRALVADLFKIWKLRVWMFDIGGRRDQRDWLNLGGGGMGGQGVGQMGMGQGHQQYGGHMMAAGGAGGPLVPDWEVGPSAAAATAGRG